MVSDNGDPCYEVTKNLAELCSRSSVLGKVQLMSNEIGYLAEEIPKQRCSLAPSDCLW